MKKRLNLIRARNKLFMTQVDLGKKLGVSRAVIDHIERCNYKKPIKKSLQVMLENILSVPIAELMEEFEVIDSRVQKKNNYEIRGDITAIFIQKRDKTVIETIIDTIDLERALEVDCWIANYDVTTNSYYVRGKIKSPDGKKTKVVRLHRWLYPNINDDEEVDHFNHDTLDNRRSRNLRKVTKLQNSQNKRPNRNNKSGIRGVYFRKGRWVVVISVNGKTKHIGQFGTKEEAKKAVIEAKKKYQPYSQEALA